MNTTGDGRVAMELGSESFLKAPMAISFQIMFPSVLQLVSHFYTEEDSPKCSSLATIDISVLIS